MLKLNMLMPILIIVGSNVVYHISEKSMPQDVDAFAALFLTYLVATICSAVMFFVMKILGANDAKNFLGELSKANWTSIALGAAVVGLEIGFLYAYRSGWQVSTAQLVASVALTCVLLVIGLLLYGEHLMLRQVLGVGICILGLFMILS